MRKWWFALAVVVGLWWGGGQRVEAALPYQDLLFENVTWSPGQTQKGILFAPPTELWVKVDTTLPVYFFGTDNLRYGTTAGYTVHVKRTDNDENDPSVKEEISGPRPDSAILIDVKTLGIQKYDISLSFNGAILPNLTMKLILHVVSALPPNLKLNADDSQIFDFVPLQLFPVDEYGHKYIVQMYNAKEANRVEPQYVQPIVTQSGRQPSLENKSVAVYINYDSGPGVAGGVRRQIGTYTIVHKPGPITVNQQGSARVKLPVIIPPTLSTYVQFRWLNPANEATVLPIEADGTVHFQSLKPSSFPMKWQIQYKNSPFTSVSDSVLSSNLFEYAGVQGKFITSQNLDLPTIPLPPLFSGSYTLSQIANGPIAVAPAWQQLDISATGPWTLQVSIKAPPALPMRLRLGAQETGTGEAPIAITGTDIQPVSLAESRLIIPKMPLLSPGEYAADITFNLIRGPTP